MKDSIEVLLGAPTKYLSTSPYFSEVLIKKSRSCNYIVLFLSQKKSSNTIISMGLSTQNRKKITLAVVGKEATLIFTQLSVFKENIFLAQLEGFIACPKNLKLKKKFKCSVNNIEKGFRKFGEVRLENTEINNVTFLKKKSLFRSDIALKLVRKMAMNIEKKGSLHPFFFNLVSKTFKCNTAGKAVLFFYSIIYFFRETIQTC